MAYWEKDEGERKEDRGVGVKIGERIRGRKDEKEKEGGQEGREIKGKKRLTEKGKGGCAKEEGEVAGEGGECTRR